MAWYESGTAVTLTAIATTGYAFSDWTGCDSASGSVCTMTMDADKTVTANFTGEPTIVTVNGRQILVNGGPFTIKGAGYSPVPVGTDPENTPPYGDYLTSDYSGIYGRDLPLLRQMGANTIRLWGWNNSSEHQAFWTGHIMQGMTLSM